MILKITKTPDVPIEEADKVAWAIGHDKELPLKFRINTSLSEDNILVLPNFVVDVPPNIAREFGLPLAKYDGTIIVKQRCDDFNPDCKEDEHCCSCCLNHE